MRVNSLSQSRVRLRQDFEKAKKSVISTVDFKRAQKLFDTFVDRQPMVFRLSMVPSPPFLKIGKTFYDDMKICEFESSGDS